MTVGKKKKTSGSTFEVLDFFKHLTVMEWKVYRYEVKDVVTKDHFQTNQVT